MTEQEIHDALAKVPIAEIKAFVAAHSGPAKSATAPAFTIPPALLAVLLQLLQGFLSGQHHTP